MKLDGEESLPRVRAIAEGYARRTRRRMKRPEEIADFNEVTVPLL